MKTSSTLLSPYVPMDASIRVDSEVGQHLLKHSRRLDEDGESDVDYSVLGQYSIKYTGCQSITQWVKDDTYYDGLSPVQPKYVAQFRLCPADKCSASGCSSRQYGDYLVDMTTFVDAYLKDKGYMSAKNNNNYNINYADGNDDGDGDDDATVTFSPVDYVRCGLYNKTETSFAGYIGAVCSSSQAIEFNVFSDSTCKTKMSSGSSNFQSAEGSSLPFSSTPLISTDEACISCESSGNGQSISYFCSDLYKVSGKCEERMYDMEYPNESACEYVDALQVMREGTFTGERPSVGATVSIEVLFAVTLCLVGYVTFLTKKLNRAKINLRFN